MTNSLAMLLQTMPDTTAAQHAVLMMIPVILLIVVIGVTIILIPFWFICKKAGFSPWLSLLNFIPLGNLVLLYVLAFAEWKVVPAPQLGWPGQPYPPPLPPQPPYPPQG